MDFTPYPHRTIRGLALTPVTAADLARALNGLLEGDSATQVSGAAPLHVGDSFDISFWLGDSWVGDARNSKCAIVLARFGLEGVPAGIRAVIQVEDPYAAMVSVLEQFHIPLIQFPEAKIAWDANIHPSAVVEGTVWPGAVIGPHCVVEHGAEVGWNSVLQANVTLCTGARIGRDCVIQPGVVVGSRGFGFRRENGKRIAVPHFAGVEIGDGVHLGANSVVASGFLEPTRIGDGSCFDSFVQIAHHCQVGKNVFMASGSGLAGGVIVEDDVEFGGAAQVAQHVRIGQGASIAARAGVTTDVPEKAVVAGFPAEPIQTWRRGIAMLRKLSERPHDNT